MISDLIHLALEECYLCTNCHRVGNSAVRCPACASETSLMGLASILDKPAQVREVRGEVQKLLDLLDEACQ